MNQEIVVDPELMARHEALSKAGGEAMAKPLPGPLLEAFSATPRAVVIGGRAVALEPVVAGHLAILQRIGSPVMGALPGQKLTMTMDHMMELVFVFTRTAAAGRKVLQGGREAFAEAAQAEIGDRMSPGEMTDIQGKLVAHLDSGFATAVPHRPPEEEGTVFLRPPAGPVTG